MRRPGVWAAAGAAVALGLALALFDPRVYTGGDNIAYYALAKALATGRGYVDLISPGTPLETKYPPGFPLLLVPFHWAFGGGYVGVKAASWVAAALALWGTWSVARRDPTVAPWAAVAAVSLVGLHPVFLEYSHWVLTEMPYLALSLAAVAAFWRAEPEEPADPADPAGHRWTGAWLAGLMLALAAFYVRTAGIVLLAAPLAHALWRRRWHRAGAAAAVGILGAGPWLAWAAAHPPPTGGYLEQLLSLDPYDPLSPRLGAGDMLARVVDQAGTYGLLELPRLIGIQYAGLTAAVVACFALTLLVVAGVTVSIRARGVQVGDLYVLLSALLLLVWPWGGDRFLLILVPFLWLYALVALDAAAVRATRRAWPAAALAALAWAVLAFGAVRAVPDQWAVTRAHMEGDELAGYDDFWTDYFEAARWTGETAPHAVIVARKPTLSWYWSGRPSAVFPLRYDPPATWRFMRGIGATHILLDGLISTELFLVPALQERMSEFQAIHSAPGRHVFVLRVLPAAP